MSLEKRIRYTPVFLKSPNIPDSIAREPISLGISSPKIEFRVGSEQVATAPSYTPVESNLQAARETLSVRTTPEQIESTNRFSGEGVDVGNMNEFLDKAESLGITFKVTSGYRKDAKTTSGNRSRHADGCAIDIIPLDGETWDDLINKFKSSPEMLSYMQENNIGFLTELTAEERAKYNDNGGQNIHISIPREKGGAGEKSAIDSRRRNLGV